MLVFLSSRCWFRHKCVIADPRTSTCTKWVYEISVCTYMFQLFKHVSLRSNKHALLIDVIQYMYTEIFEISRLLRPKETSLGASQLAVNLQDKALCE